MGVKTKIASTAASLLLNVLTEALPFENLSTTQHSNNIDTSRICDALDSAEQICMRIYPDCRREHLALFRSEFITNLKK